MVAYDGSRMREEVGLARSIHCNTIRLWIEFTAWMEWNGAFCQVYQTPLYPSKF